MNTEATESAATADPGSLKIADTPHEGPNGQPADAAAEPASDAQAETPQDAAQAPKGKARRVKGVRQLTPEQMDEEIDRVNRANGRPGIARGTHPEDAAKESAAAAAGTSPTAPSDNGHAVAGEPQKGKSKKSGRKGQAGKAKAAAAEPPHETKEQHHERRVREAQEELCRISMAHAESADLTKSLKKQRDVATQHLHDLMRDGPEDLPLIDAAEKTKESNGEAGSSQKQLPLDGNAAAGEAPSTAWRGVSVGDLGEFGMSVRTHKALVEQNKIGTLGGLADFSNENHGRLVKLKGIGKAAAEQLQDALDKFWRKNPQLVLAEPKAEANGKSAASEAAAEAPASKSVTRRLAVQKAGKAKESSAPKKSAAKNPAAKKRGGKGKPATKATKPRRR